MTLDDIKWAIVGSRKLKVKQEVGWIVYLAHTQRLNHSYQSITVIPRKNRLRVYVDGVDKYYRLRELKRVLPDVVVKVRRPARPDDVFNSYFHLDRAFLPFDVQLSTLRRATITAGKKETRNCSSRVMASRKS